MMKYWMQPGPYTTRSLCLCRYYRFLLEIKARQKLQIKCLWRCRYKRTYDYIQEARSKNAERVTKNWISAIINTFCPLARERVHVHEAIVVSMCLGGCYTMPSLLNTHSRVLCVHSTVHIHNEKRYTSWLLWLTIHKRPRCFCLGVKNYTFPLGLK